MADIKTWPIICKFALLELFLFEHGCYISALEHVRMLTLSSYVLLACINLI